MGLTKKKSWRTTVAGIVAAVGILCTQIGNVLDKDPETVISWEAIMFALGALGVGWFARDNKVTSEQAGAGE